MTLKQLPTLENAKDQNRKEALSSSSNSKSVTGDKELTKDPKKDLHILIPFQVRQGSSKERVHYDVISCLKRVSACLSVYDALQMLKELRSALIHALMGPDDYKDQVNPIEVDEVLSSLLKPMCCIMACLTFTNEDV